MAFAVNQMVSGLLGAARQLYADVGFVEAEDPIRDWATSVGLSFDKMGFPLDENGIPIITRGSCSFSKPSPRRLQEAMHKLPNGFVYFIECGEFVKIGYSREPKRRLADMQTGSPHPMRILAVRPLCDESDERALHGRFAHLRAKGEWFRADAELMRFIGMMTPWQEAAQ